MVRTHALHVKSHSGACPRVRFGPLTEIERGTLLWRQGRPTCKEPVYRLDDFFFFWGGGGPESIRQPARAPPRQGCFKLAERASPRALSLRAYQVQLVPGVVELEGFPINRIDGETYNKVGRLDLEARAC